MIQLHFDVHALSRYRCNICVRIIPQVRHAALIMQLGFVVQQAQLDCITHIGMHLIVPAVIATAHYFNDY